MSFLLFKDSHISTFAPHFMKGRRKQSDSQSVSITVAFTPLSPHSPNFTILSEKSLKTVHRTSYQSCTLFACCTFMNSSNPSPTPLIMFLISFQLKSCRMIRSEAGPFFYLRSSISSLVVFTAFSPFLCIIIINNKNNHHHFQ